MKVKTLHIQKENTSPADCDGILYKEKANSKQNLDDAWKHMKAGAANKTSRVDSLYKLLLENITMIRMKQKAIA